MPHTRISQTATRLHPLHELNPGKAVGRRASPASVVVSGSQQIVNCHLGDGQLSLVAVGSADDVGEGNTVATVRWLRDLGMRSKQLALGLGFKWCQGRCGVLLDRKIAEWRELESIHGPQAGRVCRGSKWGVIRRG